MATWRERVTALASEVGAKLGNLAGLTTTHKATLVGAINEIAAGVGGVIDDETVAEGTTWSSTKIQEAIAEAFAEGVAVIAEAPYPEGGTVVEFTDEDTGNVYRYHEYDYTGSPDQIEVFNAVAGRLLLAGPGSKAATGGYPSPRGVAGGPGAIYDGTYILREGITNLYVGKGGDVAGEDAEDSTFGDVIAHGGRACGVNTPTYGSTDGGDTTDAVHFSSNAAQAAPTDAIVAAVVSDITGEDVSYGSGGVSGYTDADGAAGADGVDGKGQAGFGGHAGFPGGAGGDGGNGKAIVAYQIGGGDLPAGTFTEPLTVVQGGGDRVHETRISAGDVTMETSSDYWESAPGNTYLKSRGDDLEDPQPVEAADIAAYWAWVEARGATGWATAFTAVIVIDGIDGDIVSSHVDMKLPDETGALQTVLQIFSDGRVNVVGDFTVNDAPVEGGGGGGGGGGGESTFYQSSIPVMTSATAPEGVASHSSSIDPSADAWHAMRQTGDNWLSAGGVPQWIGYQYSTAKTAIAYSFRAWWIDTYPGRTPTAWKFQGSNDGSSWYDLDTRSGFAPTGLRDNYTFLIAAPGSYIYYRMLISANGGDTYVGLADFRIFTEEDPAAAPFAVSPYVPVIVGPGSGGGGGSALPAPMTLATPGTYAITPEVDCTCTALLWGGPGGYGSEGQLGGAAGYAEGKISMTAGTTYLVVVGGAGADGDTYVAGYWGRRAVGFAGRPRGNNGNRCGGGGGLTGVFDSEITQAAAKLIAPGGGGGGAALGGAGGAGGDDAAGEDGVGPVAGAGATDSAGGAGAVGSATAPSGDALLGGDGAADWGGGGGAGYFGGGGGAQASGYAGPGGGGVGFAAGDVSDTEFEAGAGATPGAAANALRTTLRAGEPGAARADEAGNGLAILTFETA